MGAFFAGILIGLLIGALASAGIAKLTGLMK